MSWQDTVLSELRDIRETVQANRDSIIRIETQLAERERAGDERLDGLERRVGRAEKAAYGAHGVLGVLAAWLGLAK